MIVVGRAMTVLEGDVPAGPTASAPPSARQDPGRPRPTADPPFGLMLAALDDLQRHEVYLCTGASPTYALWGELMIARALEKARGEKTVRQAIQAGMPAAEAFARCGIL